MSVPPTKRGASASGGEDESAQLSSPVGVGEGVGSMAMDRGLLAAAAGSAAAEDFSLSGSGLSDAEIMLRVKEGDESAFEYLVQKYRRAMVSFMYRMAHSSTVAEELAQEVFLRIYRSRSGYEATAKFTTWMYRIATNLAVNHARDTRHERPENMVSLDVPDTETGQTLDIAGNRPTAEEDIIRQERLAAIRKHVEALPERQRLAVIMHKFQQMDYKQIADVLKLSESATKSLLFRAYQTLRVQLKDFL